MLKILNKNFLKESFGSMPIDTKRELFNYAEKEFSSFTSVMLELEELMQNNVIEYEVYKKDKLFIMDVQENNSIQYKYIVKLKASDFDIDNEDGLYYFITHSFGDFIPDEVSVFKSVWDGGNAGIKTKPVNREEDVRGQAIPTPEIKDTRAYILPGKELEDNSDVVDKKTKIKRKKGKDGEYHLPYLFDPDNK